MKKKSSVIENIVSSLTLVIAFGTLILGIRGCTATNNLQKYTQEKNVKEELMEPLTILFSSITYDEDDDKNKDKEDYETKVNFDSKSYTIELPIVQLNYPTGFPLQLYNYTVLEGNIVSTKPVSHERYLKSLKNYNKNNDQQIELEDNSLKYGHVELNAKKYDNDNIAAYYFILAIGFDGSKQLNAVNYTFSKKINKLNLKEGPIFYNKLNLLESFDDNDNLKALKKDYYKLENKIMNIK